MEKLTEDFIRAIKRGKISAKQSAIDFMSDYTGSPKEEYTDYVLMAMLSALQMVRVQKDGNPINGFTKMEDN